MSSLTLENNLFEILSGPDALKLLEIINDTVSAITEKELAALIEEKLHDLVDFRYATYLSAKRQNSWSFRPLNIEYPPEFLKQYQKNGFAENDPIFLAALRDPGVNYWCDLLKRYPCDKKLDLLTSEFELEQGYQWGLRNGVGDRFGSFSICGSSMERSQRTEAILHLLLPHIHQAYQRIADKKKKKEYNLTSRETEVLNWVRVGRTSWDIATILSISERTVRFHLGNIMQKLDAMSRTHAVAIALEEGLIENS